MRTRTDAYLFTIHGRHCTGLDRRWQCTYSLDLLMKLLCHISSNNLVTHTKVCVCVAFAVCLVTTSLYRNLLERGDDHPPKPPLSFYRRKRSLTLDWLQYDQRWNLERNIERMFPRRDHIHPLIPQHFSCTFATASCYSRAEDEIQGQRLFFFLLSYRTSFLIFSVIF